MFKPTEWNLLFITANNIKLRCKCTSHIRLRDTHNKIILPVEDIIKFRNIRSIKWITILNAGDSFISNFPYNIDINSIYKKTPLMTLHRTWNDTTLPRRYASVFLSPSLLHSPGFPLILLFVWWWVEMWQRCILMGFRSDRNWVSGNWGCAAAS